MKLYAIKVSYNIYWNDSDEGRCQAGEIDELIRFGIDEDQADLATAADTLRGLIAKTTNWIDFALCDKIRNIWPAYDDQDRDSIVIAVIQIDDNKLAPCLSTCVARNPSKW